MNLFFNGFQKPSGDFPLDICFRLGGLQYFLRSIFYFIHFHWILYPQIPPLSEELPRKIAGIFVVPEISGKLNPKKSEPDQEQTRQRTMVLESAKTKSDLFLNLKHLLYRFPSPGPKEADTEDLEIWKVNLSRY